MTTRNEAAACSLDPDVRDAVRQCFILFPRYSSIEPKDVIGCHLPIGHDGPHEFVSTNGDTYRWETDWSCDCDECKKDDGDLCYLYWPVIPNPKMEE